MGKTLRLQITSPGKPIRVNRILKMHIDLGTKRKGTQATKCSRKGGEGIRGRSPSGLVKRMRVGSVPRGTRPPEALNKGGVFAAQARGGVLKEIHRSSEGKVSRDHA